MSLPLHHDPRRAPRAALLLLLLAAGCAEPGTQPDMVARMDISAPALSVVEGGTLQLSATARDGSGNTLSYQPVWTSSDTVVAVVSAAGLVTARQPGMARIIASAGGRAGSLDLSVTPAEVAAVAISPQPANVALLKVLALSAEVRDARGVALRGRTLAWASSDPSVASVDAAGVVTGRGLGSAEITASVAGKQGSVRVTVTPSGVNLFIGGMYLVQTVQTPSGSVPLVAGREGWLRVFALSSEPGTQGPGVRVRLFHGGAESAVIDVPALAATTPTVVTEGEWTASWNVRIPAGMVRPGLSVLAEVNPGGAAETDAGDNLFPRSGQPLVLDVREAPPHRVVMIPVRQTATGLTGNVTEQRLPEILALSRKIFPIADYQATVRPPYESTGLALNASNDNGSWTTLLSEINALRVAEGSEAYYYGVIKRPFTGAGTAGYGYIGGPTAIGYDGPAVGTIFAHETGHNFGRLHAPCGGPAGADPAFPHSGATIGAYGVDAAAGVLKSPGLRDIMSYCYEWISDYTYRGIMDFRAARGGGAASVSPDPAGPPAPSLLVWGRTGPRGIELEPAFRLTTRPALPPRPGPYTLEGLDAGGRPVFSLSFAPVAVADGEPGEAHFAFAFAVPLDAAGAERVVTLRVTGAGRRAERRAALAPAPSRAPAPGVRASRGTGTVSLAWDAARFPMVMVRDPRTGHVLSFARGGAAALSAPAGEVELVMSDGVRSVVERVR